MPASEGDGRVTPPGQARRGKNRDEPQSGWSANRYPTQGSVSR